MPGLKLNRLHTTVLTQANERHPGNREILTVLVSMHQAQGDTAQAQRYTDELALHYPQAAGGR